MSRPTDKAAAARTPTPRRKTRWSQWLFYVGLVLGPAGSYLGYMEVQKEASREHSRRSRQLLRDGDQDGAASAALRAVFSAQGGFEIPPPVAMAALIEAAQELAVRSPLESSAEQINRSSKSPGDSSPIEHEERPGWIAQGMPGVDMLKARAFHRWSQQRDPAEERTKRFGPASDSISTDGTYAITTQPSGFAHLWNLKTGASLYHLDCHSQAVTKAQFSLDSSHVVTASEDGTACVWDLRAYPRAVILTGHDAGLLDADFSPDGTRVVTAGTDWTARVWDVETGTQQFVLAGHQHWVKTASYSHDGANVLTISRDGTFRLWDAKTGGPLPPPRVYSAPVREAHFSPDRSRLLIMSEDRTAVLWNVRSSGFVDFMFGLRSARMSPDSAQILSLDVDGQIRLWDTASRTLQTIIADDYHRDGDYVKAFSPDGRRLLVDHHGRSVRVWDVRTGQQLATFGKPLPSTRKGRAALFDLGSRLTAAAFSTEGDKIFTIDNEGNIYRYSLRMEPYIRYACQRLRSSPAEWSKVASDCNRSGVR